MFRHPALPIMALLVVAACAESPTAPASSLNESPNLLIGQSPLAPIRLVSTMKDGVTIQRVLEIPVEVSIGSANIGAGEWFALRTGTTFHAPDGGTHVVNPKVDPAVDEALRSGKPVSSITPIRYESAYFCRLGRNRRLDRGQIGYQLRIVAPDPLDEDRTRRADHGAPLGIRQQLSVFPGHQLVAQDAMIDLADPPPRNTR